VNKNISSEYGQIKIHRKVIRQIAEETARQVKGVKAVGLECYGQLGWLLKLFKVNATKVTFENEMKIVIPVNVMWQHNLVDVAYEVQKQIISHMLNNLNIDTLSVDVKIKKVVRG
jgi:uncharacterized alkaline shock family protein YloU